MNKVRISSFLVGFTTNIMTIEDLRNIHEHYKVAKPKLFMLSSPDRCATQEDIANVETQIGVSLPLSYRNVLNEFGGGLLGFVNIFSADAHSDYYLPAKLIEASAYLPSGLLPFSDDNAGGLYVFKIVEGKADEIIYYWNADGGLVGTKYGDIMEFIARLAYEPA